MQEGLKEEIKRKVKDLVAASGCTNVSWNAWELEFIEAMENKLEDDPSYFTKNMYEKINEMWEKI